MKIGRPATEIFSLGRATSFTATDADARALADLIQLNPSYTKIGVTALFRSGLQALLALELQKQAILNNKQQP
jgi:hypothetical protein